MLSLIRIKPIVISVGEICSHKEVENNESFNLDTIHRSVYKLFMDNS